MLDVHEIYRGQQRIRAELAGLTVVDSVNALLLLRPGRFGVFLFPRDEILLPLRAGASGADPNPRYRPGPNCSLETPPDQWWDLELDAPGARSAAWAFSSPTGEFAALRDHVGLVWSQMDHWYEEDEEIFGHPKSPYHRVDVVPSSRRVRIRCGDSLLASSDSPVAVFESGLPPQFYLHPDEVDSARLQRSELQTHCAYKGFASYWHVEGPDGVHANAVWSYEQPLPAVAGIAGLYGFMASLLDVYVDDEHQGSPFAMPAED